MEVGTIQSKRWAVKRATPQLWKLRVSRDMGLRAGGMPGVHGDGHGGQLLLDPRVRNSRQYGVGLVCCHGR